MSQQYCIGSVREGEEDSIGRNRRRDKLNSFKTSLTSIQGREELI